MMNKKSPQKEAVFSAAVEALNLNQEDLVKLEQPLKSMLTKTVEKQIREKLFAGFRAGTVPLKAEKTDSQLKKYCSSVLNNWKNRDPRFN